MRRLTLAKSSSDAMFTSMKHRPAPPPSDEDIRLFHDAIGPVRALQPRSEVAAPKPGPEPEARQFQLDEVAVSGELLTHSFDAGSIEMGDELLHLKDGQPPKLLRDLRRGKFSIRAEIDLHQMTIPVAREAIRLFLEDAHRNGEYCVRIIHGKGLRSKANGPVIKRLTDSMLRRRADVLAYASALPSQGGTGAVIVLLAR